MSDTNSQQRNDKKHRKLVREKLSPCDLDTSSSSAAAAAAQAATASTTNNNNNNLSSSYLSAATNIFAPNVQPAASTANNSRSSPTKCYADHFPTNLQHQQQQQQLWPAGDNPAALALTPSSSNPTIALYRKPSITIKYSKDEDHKPKPSSSYQSSLSSHYHQQISKSIDSNHSFSTKTISTAIEQQQQHQQQQQQHQQRNVVDQASSNNFLINGIPGCCLHNNVNLPIKQQQQQQSLFNFNDEGSTTTTTTSASTAAKQIPVNVQQMSLLSHSPTSQSLNLNLINQSHFEAQCAAGSQQIVFNSNNPFLNDNFDAITTHEDEGGGRLENFFNIDDTNDTELLFPLEETAVAAAAVRQQTLSAAQSTDDDVTETQLLRNKREKFSNASTMKICLVVSPPTNKLFQLKSKSLTHLDRIQPQINISSNESYAKNINGEKDVTLSINSNDRSSNIAAATATIATATATKFTTPSNGNQNEINCISKANDLVARNDATIITNSSSASVVNSHTDNPITTSSSQIKKKSSSFLHRDYNRKPILARSQVSSSEYFSVCFDTENGFKDKDEIFIAATKGIALGDSLRQAMNQRCLSFSQLLVIDYGLNNSNELGIPQYFGPLEINTDIGILAGHSLLVTERDNVLKKSGHYVLKKAASVGYRSTRLFTSASTEESLETNDTTKTTTKQPKPRWSLQLFGVKNPQQNQLCELLNTYMKNGVPKSKSSYINSEYSDEALEALYGLPQSWRDFVNACDITETDTKIQSAIWELVTTEVDYIHAIQTVTDLFLSCLEGIQFENLLKDIDQHKLFSNIRDICDANLKLWSLYLYPMVKHSMLTGHLMCIDYFQQGFTNFACIFEPYAKYCAEQVLCQNYCKDLNRNNSLFTAYLAWCESQKECNRLRLSDNLVRPMQRLTKYNLLLSAIRKHITEENEAEIMDAMIHSVDEFVCSVNSHLTTRQENERLKGIMARIESYDVVDSNNESLEKLIKQYSQMFDLCAPMKGCVVNQGRYLFLEGDMKYKDNISKMDVHCFLLTDILLVCKQTAKKGHGNLKVIRQPFITDRLVIKLKEKENVLHCVYLNDFNMAIAAFILQCNEAKSWFDSIAKARHIYMKLKHGSPFIDGLSVKVTPQQHASGGGGGVAGGVGIENIIKKSPLGSSIVSSLNNSHSGSVELNESKTVSVDFEKTNSISSDEGSYSMHNKNHQSAIHNSNSNNRKLRQTSSNSLTVQSCSTHLNQSMPNLTSGPYHINSNNTLLVPGAPKSHSAHSSHSGNLLSPSQRGISYPPPSPTRATLRRGFAFSSSINNKNPPLIKSRNVTSNCSFNWTQQQSVAAAAAAAAAGTAAHQQQQQQIHQTNAQQPSHIQVVYEPTQSDSDVTNRPELNDT